MTDPTPVGAPIWIDLFTSDPDASAAFYGGLFGWSAESSEAHGGYITYSLDGRRVAGGMANDGSSGAPDGWTVYLQTDDAEATTTAARAQGSDVIVEPMAVEDLGSFAVVTDAGGAVVGMWQPGSHTGFEGRAEPGFPGWFELHTRDYEPALRFYEEVFGWKVHTAAAAPDVPYSTLLEGPDGRAGVMDATAFLPEGVPAHWSVYFQVADVDASLARVTELGGAVVMGAQDTPYGRLAIATDATGGPFKLLA